MDDNDLIKQGLRLLLSNREAALRSILMHVQENMGRKGAHEASQLLAYAKDVVLDVQVAIDKYYEVRDELNRLMSDNSSVTPQENKDPPSIIDDEIPF